MAFGAAHRGLGGYNAAPMSRTRVLTLALVLPALGCLDAFQDGSANADATAALADPRPVVARGDLAEDERSTIELFRRASPSVVFITTRELRRQLFSLRPLEVESGSGSGFVWDRQGNIVTNYHVIQRADSAQVTLADQSVWDAELIGVPTIVVCGRGIDPDPSKSVVEVKDRRSGERVDLALGDVVAHCRSLTLPPDRAG